MKEFLYSIDWLLFIFSGFLLVFLLLHRGGYKTWREKYDYLIFNIRGARGQKSVLTLLVVIGILGGIIGSGKAWGDYELRAQFGVDYPITGKTSECEKDDDQAASYLKLNAEWELFLFGRFHESCAEGEDDNTVDTWYAGRAYYPMHDLVRLEALYHFGNDGDKFGEINAQLLIFEINRFSVVPYLSYQRCFTPRKCSDDKTAGVILEFAF